MDKTCQNIARKLSKLIKNNGDSSRIEGYESSLAENLQSIVNEDFFYDLPIENIVNIVKNSDMSDIKLLKSLSANQFLRKIANLFFF